MAVSWALAVLFSGPARSAWDHAAINRTIDGSNVLVNAGCSGTVVAPQTVLTASHCVLEQFRDVTREKIGADGKVEKETVRIAVPGTVSQIAYGDSLITRTVAIVFKVVAIDRQVDLALLHLAAPMGAPVAIGCKAPARADTVYAVGNPFGVLYASLSQGIVGSTERSYRDLQLTGQLGDAADEGEHGLVQHTALIAPGNSGGALYDADGKLVGVNVRGGSGFAFAVPLGDVQTFLRGNGVAACNG